MHLTAVLGLLASSLVLVVTASPAQAAVSQVSLVVAGDGTAPFDTLDANANNGIVRTHDVVSYVWNYTTDADAATTNVTFTQTLPAPTPAGVRFAPSNLAQCTGPNKGTISVDGHTLTCQVALRASASGTIPITVNVDGTPPNGSAITSALSASSGGAQISGGTTTTQIAAQPQLNLLKNVRANATATTINGVRGRLVNYTAAITQNPANTKGAELVTGPLTWSDDLAQVSPNATLVECRVYGANNGPDNPYGLPWGKVGIQSTATATNSVTDSGAIACAQPGGPGTAINVTVTGADTSANTVPTRTSQNLALPVNAAFVGTYRLNVFIPNADIAAAGGAINTTNQFRGFDPTSISGQSNYGVNYEPGGEPTAAACPFVNNNGTRANDNCYSATVVAQDGVGDKFLVTNDQPNTGTYAGQASGAHAGNGTTAAGSGYISQLYVFDTGSTDLTGAALCDRWNPATQRLNADGRVWLNTTTQLVKGTDYRVQFAALPMTTDDQRRTTGCGDNAGTWYDSIAAAGGVTQVNAVRFLLDRTLVPNDIVIAYVKFTVPTGTPSGTIVGDWAGLRLDGSQTTWGTSTYNKETNVGGLGDRITVTSATLRLSKNTVPANTQSILAGNTVRYTMQPQVVNTLAPGDQNPSRNVTVTDQLPPCTSYVPGSGSIEPQITPGNNGPDNIPCTADAGEVGERLTFNLGDVIPNTTLPPITYTVDTLKTTPDATRIPNTAVISSADSQAVDAAQRTAAYDLVVRNVQQFLIEKVVNTPVVEVNDPYSYTLTYRNLTASTIGQAQLIDELPYNGDGRNTAFTGTTAFTGFTGLSNGLVAECTTAAHGTIDPDPGANTNTWSTTCPANTTAVRLTATNIGAGGAGAVTINFTPTGNAGGDDYINNIAAARVTGNALLIPSTDNVRVDVIASTIGDRVFTDTNANGVQDAGEGGVANFPVTLTGTDSTGRPVTLTTTTGTDGTYSFANLHSGTYTVTFDPAGLTAGQRLSPQDAGGNDATDSDGSPTTGATAAITLGAQTVNNNVDQGVVPATGVSGSVKTDTGAPLGGVTITLTGTDSQGNTVSRTTTTLADGSWNIPGLPASNATGYTVTETQPTAYGDGTVTPGIRGGTANGANQVIGIVLPAGMAGTGYDFVETTSSLAGTVYVDANRNGTRDTGETPLGGVTVTVTGTDVNGAAVTRTVQTAANGAWSAAGLPAGTYQVTETQPAGYGDGDDTLGSFDGTHTGTDTVAAITVPAGQSGTGYDFGEVPGSIAGSVYVDANNDGVRDPAEDPIGNVTVTLTGTTSGGVAVTRTTTTAADGSYRFDNLPAGTYEVSETQPDGYADGKDTPGSAGGTAGAPNTISAIDLAGGEQATDYLFGERLGIVTGTVYLDADRDGTLGPDETTRLPGVPVQLLDANGTVVRTTTTAADGSYVFTGLAPGQYSVVEQQPDGYGSSTPNTVAVTVGADRGADVDFGETLGRIGDRVFADTDRDGVQDPGEKGVAGVRVTLYDSTGAMVATTTTAADGSYHFDVRTGTYTVGVSLPTGQTFTQSGKGDDRTKDSDIVPATGRSGPIRIGVDPDGEVTVDNDVDAGLVPVVHKLGITITPNEPAFRVGDRAVWTVDVVNRGTVPETGLRTTITLPPGTRLTGAQGNGWTCTTSGQVAHCVYPGTVQPGAHPPVITLPSTALVTGRHVATATVTTHDNRYGERASASVVVNDSGSLPGDDTNNPPGDNNPSGDLPWTGAPVLPLGTLALGLVMLGGGLLLATRRRFVRRSLRRRAG